MSLLKFNKQPSNYITNLVLSKDIDQILFELKYNNPSNLNFANLDINSVRNKFENFQEVINGNGDIFTIVETKLDGSFSTSQFEIVFTIHLDLINQIGRFLIYLKSLIHSRQLSFKVFVILYKLFHLRSM